MRLPIKKGVIKALGPKAQEFRGKHPYVADFTVGGVAGNAGYDAMKAGYTKTKDRSQNKHPQVKGG